MLSALQTIKRMQRGDLPGHCANGGLVFEDGERVGYRAASVLIHSGVINCIGAKWTLNMTLSRPGCTLDFSVDQRGLITFDLMPSLSHHVVDITSGQRVASLRKWVARVDEQRTSDGSRYWLVTTQVGHVGSRRYRTFKSLASAIANLRGWYERRFRLIG